jgi:hypothetical protein
MIEENELFINYKKRIINCLEYFSNFEKYKTYEESVPYVNVFDELYYQWINSYKIEKQMFVECFSRKQLEMLKMFNSLYLSTIKKIKPGQENAKNLFQNKYWKTVISLADKLLLILPPNVLS